MKLYKFGFHYISFEYAPQNQWQNGMTVAVKIKPTPVENEYELYQRLWIRKTRGCG